MVIILMGVSGCGKTTVGKILAEQLSLPFYDADNFHPKENVEKMRSGKPLTDEDRIPWLDELSRQIAEWSQTGGAVLACSALKQWYRDRMTSSVNESDVSFVYLKGSKSLIADRLAQRKGHYMPAELLDSQLNTLEEPHDATMISIQPAPEKVVRAILLNLNLS
jgi:carbohydrate kinase (thermoresistant glucokinase family)